jgi:hypothetical protein
MRARLINEDLKQGSVFRSTDQNWLRIFLDQDQIIHAKPGRFISLSYDSDSGGMDNFGGKEVVIEFNEEKIMQQEANPIYYEPEWFDKYKEACMYVLAYKGEKDYYEQKGYAGPEEAERNMDFTWEQIIEDYEHEQEILMKKIKFVPGIIKNILIINKPHPILIEMLEENNIPYEHS